ncbi:hypothetical protein ASZ90_015332 [hydrocarbon metagenome]|uniref:Uncharacterized protein n=1 Tax=hydrocarbon metagenome TaxID=938273 RepID=A0A0W8F2B7_9ZZZZ
MVMVAFRCWWQVYRICVNQREIRSLSSGKKFNRARETRFRG